MNKLRLLESVINNFPQQFSLAFAYGSAVFPQSNSQTAQNSMTDFIFAVDNPLNFHKENLKLNSSHYSLVKFGTAEFVRYLQENFGAKIYFNTLVKVEDVLIKYGVISTNHLIEDLLDWETLYISGRLHKPVTVLKQAKNADLARALHTNLQSAIHASLLSLPETFTEEQLYRRIVELSYYGDFRMYFGEDKSKIENIVKNQIKYFRRLYYEHIKSMPLLHWNHSQGVIEQDCSGETVLHHLNLLPKTVQHNILIRRIKDGRYKDIEDVFLGLAYQPECAEIVEAAICDIVRWSSITQGLKGLATAGILRSAKYSSRKLGKMFKSLRN